MGREVGCARLGSGKSCGKEVGCARLGGGSVGLG